MNLIDNIESAVTAKSACVVFILYICRIQLVLVTASCLVKMKKCLNNKRILGLGSNILKSI